MSLIIIYDIKLFIIINVIIYIYIYIYIIVYPHYNNIVYYYLL